MPRDTIHAAPIRRARHAMRDVRKDRPTAREKRIMTSITGLIDCLQKGSDYQLEPLDDLFPDLTDREVDLLLHIFSLDIPVRVERNMPKPKANNELVSYRVFRAIIDYERHT